MRPEFLDPKHMHSFNVSRKRAFPSTVPSEERRMRAPKSTTSQSNDLMSAADYWLLAKTGITERLAQQAQRRPAESCGDVVQNLHVKRSKKLERPMSALPSSPLADDMLGHALRLVAMGWSVIPLQGKVSLTKHGSHDGTVSPDQVREWWRKWPEANRPDAARTVMAALFPTYNSRTPGASYSE